MTKIIWRNLVTIDLRNVPDYGWCKERDAEHDPVPAPVHDKDMPPGYFTIECAACHQTTGYPMPDPEDIDWG